MSKEQLAARTDGRLTSVKRLALEGGCRWRGSPAEGVSRRDARTIEDARGVLSLARIARRGGVAA